MTAQRIGVQLVVDGSQLQPGLAAYLNTLNQINAANKSLRPLALNFGPAQQQMNNLTSSAIGFSAGIGAAIGTASVNAVNALIGAISNLSNEILENIGFWERLGISVEFFEARQKMAVDETLSMEQALSQVGNAADGTIAYIQQLAILSPFTSKDVGTIYRTALGFGLVADQAKTLLPLLVDLGSAAGLAPEYLERVSLAFAQIQARGKLTAEEIRQLGNAGVNIREILVKALKISNAEFDKMLEQGMFLSGTVLPLIVDSLKDYEGAAKRAATETVTGLLSSLQDVREIGQVKFFEGMSEQIKTQLNDLLAIVNTPFQFAKLQVMGEEVGRIMNSIVTSIRNAVTSIISAWNSLDPVTKRTIVTFAALAAGITVLVGAVSLISIALGLLINPFTVLVTTVAALGAAWANDFYGIKTTTENVVNSIVETFNQLASNVSQLASEVISATGTIVQAFVETLSAATEWGANIVTSFAEGIISAVSTVMQALSVMGEAMAFMLAPGSPPRLLPDLDKWGTEAANVYLEAWTEADFGILNTITSAIRDVLSSIGADPLDIPGILLGSGQAIAEAINQIREIGYVTDEAMQEVIRTTGKASEQVVALLTRYQALSNATKVLEQAQKELNAATEYYDKLLKPLRAKLTELQDAQAQSDEQKELAKLQRIIASRYASDARKQSAIQRQQTILTQQRIRELEREQSKVTDAAQEKVDAAQKAVDAAQAEMDKYKERLKIQTQQGDLLREQEAILLRLAGAMGGMSEKAQKVMSDLERQLAIYQLQQEELNDQIALKQAQAVLEDENATAAQKYAAQLKINSILVRQQLRDIEAAKLGISLEEVRKIPIVFEDWAKAAGGAKAALDGLAGSWEGLSNNDVIQKAFISQRLALEAARQQWELNRKEISSSIEELNKNLPAALKLTADEAGKIPPILDTITKSLLAITGFFVVSNLVKSVAVLGGAFLGLGKIFGFLTPVLAPVAGIFGRIGAALIGLSPWIIGAVAVISALGAAWQYNLFGIQEKTAWFVVEVQNAFENLKANLLSFWQNIEQEGSFKEYINVLKNAWQYSLTEVQRSTVWLVSEVQNAFENLKANLLSFWQSVAMEGGFQEYIGKQIEGLKQKLSEGLTSLTEWANQTKEWISSGGIQETISVWFMSAIAKIQEWLAQLPGMAYEWMNAFITAFGSLVSSIVENITYWVVRGFIEFGRGIAQFFAFIASIDWGGILQGIISAISNLAQAIWNAITSVDWFGLTWALLTGINDAVQYFIMNWQSIVVYLGVVILDGLVRAFFYARSELPQVIIDFFRNFADLFVGYLAKIVYPVISGVAVGIGRAFIDSGAPDVGEWFVNFGNKLRQMTENMDVMEIGRAINNSIRGALESFIEPLEQGIENVKNYIVNTFKNAFMISTYSVTIYNEIGVPLMDGLVNSIKDMVENVVNAVLSIKDAIFSPDIVLKFVEGAKQLGLDIAGGITSGISGKLQDAQKGIGDFIDGVLGFGRSEAEIESPSKLFAREIGKPIGEGIVEGVKSVQLNVIAQVVRKAVIDAFKIVRDNNNEQLKGLSQDSQAIIDDMAKKIVTRFETFALSIKGVMATLTGSISLAFMLLALDVQLSVNNMTYFVLLTFNTFVISFLLALTSMIMSTNTGFTNMQYQVVSIVGTMAMSLSILWNSVVVDTSTLVQAMTTLVIALFTKMRDDSVALVQNLKDEIIRILTELVEKLRDEWVPMGEELGEDFMRGVEAGMRDRIDAIAAAAAAAVRAAINAAKAEAETASPSKRMAREVGKPLAQGLEVGMMAEMKSVRDNVFGAISSTISGAQNRVLNAFGSSASSPSQISSVTNTSSFTNIKNYNLTINSGQSTGNVRRDFAVMEILAV